MSACVQANSSTMLLALSSGLQTTVETPQENSSYLHGNDNNRLMCESQY